MNPRAAFVVAALLAGAPVHAATVAYACTYPKVGSEQGIQLQDPPFVFTFSFDTISRKAFMLGTKGSVEVFVVEHVPGGISFVEMTTGGSVQVTAIAKDLRSSHSRSTLMGEQLLATQYYGSCTVR